MDKLVLASPYCSISDKSVHGQQYIDHLNFEDVVQNMPITFQPPQEPNLSMDEEVVSFTQQKNESRILQHAKEVLEKSLENYKYYRDEKPNGDLEHDNQLLLFRDNYVQVQVPIEFDEIMFCIEGLIHRTFWDKRDFGQYEQIYRTGLGKIGKAKLAYLSQLRMCLMWAIPEDEYYKETEVVDPMFGSSSRTIEA